MDTSKAETGSSHTMYFGFRAKARAMPIRCLWPPENSCGKRFIYILERPTFSMRISIFFWSALPFAKPCIERASPIILSIVKRGLREL